MTNLFLRFYLGVIAILIVSWLIQAYVFRFASQEDNIRVAEDALSGGALLARDEIVRGGEAEFEATIERIKSRFPYQVAVVAESKMGFPEAVRERLRRDEVVLHWNRVYTSIPSTEYLVQLGPLPEFVGPPNTAVLLGLGAISVLTAIGIALLLRPVASQLRGVERTALAIAGGDLSARIGGAEARRSIPISNAFNQMAERVEKLLRSQRELLQAVSHEFRTPLARIQFATELGRAASTLPQVHERLGAIDEATEQLNDLVGELLMYTKLDHEEMQVDLEVVDLLSVVRSSIEEHESLYPQVSFVIKTSSTPLEIVSEAKAMRRAVGNLISNAGKYASSQVVVQLATESDGVSVMVEDDGVGIAVADRELIFEPFKRLEDGKPGTGLGLALVNRICQRLGGRVTVDESPQGGARFSMYLPSAHASMGCHD